jgi:flagellar protein FlbD
MIQLTRLNNQPLVVNSDLIKTIEYAPDTVITLVNGDKIVVRETGEEILARIVKFRRRVLDGLHMNFSGWTSPSGEASEAKRNDPSPEEA